MSALWFIAFSLIWTGLLAGGAHLLTRGTVPARFAHTIWRGAAVLSVLPWVIAIGYRLLPNQNTSPIPDLPYVGGAAEAMSANPTLQAAAETASSPFIGWAMATILFLGWGARIVMNALCQWRLQNIKAKAQVNDTIQADHWANILNLRQVPRVATIPNGSPFLAGIKQRTIYLPETVTSQADADIILAHECTHVARGDLLTRPFERLVADIFWFSPFAWMMRRQLDYWREAACDQQTAKLTGDSVAYARALANTARATRPIPFKPLPVAAFILPRQETLKKRLTQLLEPKAQKPRRNMAVLALVFGALLAPLSLAQISGTPSSIFTHAIVLHEDARITSPYGKRKDPWTGQYKVHAGVDIGAEKYAPIFMPADGKVILSKKKEGYGNTVDVLLADGTKLRFSQLEKAFVAKGDIIKAGTKIGKMGMTGRATGPHLHFEVYVDGEHLDPTKVKGLTLFENCCPEEA